MSVNNLPVAVPLLEHQRNRGGPRAELLCDLWRSRRWQQRGRVAEEARDRDRPVAIQLDQPIAILREGLHAGESLLELIERGLLDPHVRRLVGAPPPGLHYPDAIGAH